MGLAGIERQAKKNIAILEESSYKISEGRKYDKDITRGGK